MRKGEIALINEVTTLLIVLLIIGMVVFSGCKLWNISDTNKEKAKAQGSLDLISGFLEGLKEGQNSSIIISNPVDFYIISYDISSSKEGQCFSKNCVCICNEINCDGKVSECTVISLPLKNSEGKNVFFRIYDIQSYNIANKKDSFYVDYKNSPYNELDMKDLAP